MMDEFHVHGAADSNKDMNEFLLGTQKTKLRDRILLSPYTKFLLPSLLVAFIVPVTVYAVMISPYVTVSSYSVTTCNLREEYRVDCFPGKNTTKSVCTESLCCWDDDSNFCYHTVPSQHGYTPYSGVYYEGEKLVPRETKSPLGSENVAQIYIDVKSVDSNHVEIWLGKSSEVTSARKRRGLKSPSRDVEYEDLHGEDEVTQRLLYFLPRDRRRRTMEIELDASSNLNAYVHYPEFSVTVARLEDSTDSILSTARGPLILTDTYWEWTLHLTNGSVYGLNDLELNGTTNFIYNNENGTITPAFLAISQNGLASACYLDYKGPMEVQVLNASNLIILRGMGLPESMSIHLFAGPTPLEAVQQLTLALTSSSETTFGFPPEYNYGLHVCPNGESNSTEEALSELNNTIASLETLSVVWDSHCLHEELASVLNHDLSTEDLEVVQTAKNYLENVGRTFSPHLSPVILGDGANLHNQLENSGLLLSNGSISYAGVYQDKEVFYPDWQNSDTKTMATSYLSDYLSDVGSPVSLWVRDAWPKDESNSSLRTDVDFTVFDYMPEKLENLMNNMTVPYHLVTSSGDSHHATHNSYSQEFRTFLNSSTKTIDFLGPPGENGNTSWSGLRKSVRSAVGSGAVAQLPPPNYVCGTSDFTPSIHDELCIRWYQAAVAWPYVISLADRLPGGSLLSASASLNAAKALRLRATLATYQHTLMASFSGRGAPLLAPTYLHFPQDATLAHTEDQFMWGESILVGLVTLPGVSQVAMRLPGNISWLHLMGGAEAVPTTNGTTPVTATIGQIIILVRPGHVVPVHEEVGETTRATISNNLTLAVNLKCYEEAEAEEEEEEEAGKACSASGEIYYGNELGDYLSINVNRTHLELGNIINVQNYACDNDDGTATTNQLYQATFIQTVQLLGNSSYQVDTELCDILLNNVAISLA